MKQTEGKHWKIERKKIEEYEEIQLTTIKISGFTFYVKHILLENIVWKKSSLYHQILLTVLCVAGYLNLVIIQQSSIYINMQIIV